MKIFIDIGHPAHVHYFRNFIKIMENKGHEFFVSARDKEVAQYLLNYYKIKFTTRGKGRKSLFGKLTYIFEADYKIYKLAKKFNPDLFLSFSSAYLAHVSKLLNKPHIAFDDTEHAKFEHILTVPFTDVLLTPKCYSKYLGKKQVYFDSYMELSYLRKKYFQPVKNIKFKLGLKENEEYIILRFVSWGASHDVGQTGLTNKTKEKIIKELENKYKIFISSESELPQKFQKYKLKINPEDLHSVLAYAKLYIGEGSTTASECSMLGTPSIYINSLTVGYCTEQDRKYSLCRHLVNEKNIFKIITEMLNRSNYENNYKRMLKDKIDLTAFMVWFIENYPNSKKIMQENPNYQYKFR